MLNLLTSVRSRIAWRLRTWPCDIKSVCFRGPQRNAEINLGGPPVADLSIVTVSGQRRAHAVVAVTIVEEGDQKRAEGIRQPADPVGEPGTRIPDLRRIGFRSVSVEQRCKNLQRRGDQETEDHDRYGLERHSVWWSERTHHQRRQSSQPLSFPTVGDQSDDESAGDSTDRDCRGPS